MGNDEKGTMEELMNLIRNLQNKLDEQTQEIRDMKQSIPQTINHNIDTKFENLELKYNTLQKSMDEQSQRIQQLERKIRKKNLIFFGIKEGERNYFELQQSILDILKQKMDLNYNETNIEEVRRLGKKQNDEKTRPIVVTLNTLGIKINILKNKKKLNNTQYYIKEDFPPEILEERKKLSTQLQEERNKGRKAFLKYNKLIIIPEEQEDQQYQKAKRNQNPNKRNLSESPENTYGYLRKDNTQNPSKRKNSNIQQYMVKNPNQNKDSLSTPPHIDNTSTALSKPHLNMKN